MTSRPTSTSKGKGRNLISGKDRSHFKIYVKIEPTDETVTLKEVYSEMKISELKSYMEFTTGIPVHLQRLSYLDEGDLLDDSDVRSNDIVAGGTLLMRVWSQWRELVQAVVFNDFDWVSQLGVSENTNYTTPNSQYMQPRCRRAFIQQRANLALSLAAHRGHKDLVKKLINLGSDVNSQTPLGRSSLHLAASQGRGHIIDTLLDKGANIDLEDNMGRNALTIADMFGHKNCERHLFLFRWQGRATKLRPSMSAPLMAHQCNDSKYPVWKIGKQSQVYLSHVLPPQEYQGTVIHAPKHRSPSGIIKRQEYRRVKEDEDKVKLQIKIFDVDATEGEEYVDDSWKEPEKSELKVSKSKSRPPTHEEWLGKITSKEKKVASSIRQIEDLKKEAEEEKKKEELDKASTYEAWLQQKEVDKRRRSTSARERLPAISVKEATLAPLPPIPVRPTERAVGALRLYLQSLGKDRAGQPYEEWLDKKEMEILKG